MKPEADDIITMMVGNKSIVLFFILTSFHLPWVCSEIPWFCCTIIGNEHWLDENLTLSSPAIFVRRAFII